MARRKKEVRHETLTVYSCETHEEVIAALKAIPIQYPTARWNNTNEPIDAENKSDLEAMEIYGFPVELEVFKNSYDGIRVTFGTPPRITL